MMPIFLLRCSLRMKHSMMIRPTRVHWCPLMSSTFSQLSKNTSISHYHMQLVHSPSVSTGIHTHTHTCQTLLQHQINKPIRWWLRTQNKVHFLLGWLFLFRICYRPRWFFMKSHFCVPNAVRITDVWISYCGCHLRRRVSCPAYWIENLFQLSSLICFVVYGDAFEYDSVQFTF